ncbi:MAG: hypothetical protein AAFV53_00170 [Myxococcota bacterium]
MREQVHDQGLGSHFLAISEHALLCELKAKGSKRYDFGHHTPNVAVFSGTPETGTYRIQDHKRCEADMSIRGGWAHHMAPPVRRTRAAACPAPPFESEDTEPEIEGMKSKAESSRCNPMQLCAIDDV